MAWRGSRARGVFRAPACIAFSRERHRLRLPVAPVRQALVRMLTWPIISAGKSKRPIFTAKAIAKYGRDSANRFEALEPVRQGVNRCFGSIAPGVARGLKLRHDHG